MTILAFIMVLAAFPAFIALLQSRPHRKWAYVALGAMPMLYAPLNLDGSFISWPVWPGHARGLTLTIVDPLALAICLRYARDHPRAPLLWAFAIYLACLLAGLFAGMFTPASFFFFQTLRIALFFYAVYLAVLGGQLMRIAEGLAVATIASGAVSVYNGLSGAFQAQGILGHQNLSGLATNLCVPLLLALGLTTRRWLFLIAVGAAASGAIAGGSRGTIIFLGLSMAAITAAIVMLKPSGRRLAIAGVTAVGLLVAAPFAVQKLFERDAGLDKDAERIAFERAAEMMSQDHIWGVGLNQYILVANTEGYSDRAGVRWGSRARSTNVHNTYLLIRAEAGLLGLCGLLIWILSPLVTACLAVLRKRAAHRELSFACAVAIAAAALHGNFEWILITTTPQYLISLMMGIIAAIWSHSPRRRAVPSAVQLDLTYAKRR